MLLDSVAKAFSSVPLLYAEATNKIRKKKKSTQEAVGGNGCAEMDDPED